MADEEGKLPVRVFLPLRLNQRHGAFVSELWVTEVLKRPDFDETDLENFRITTTYENPWGVTQTNWYLTVRSINFAARTVLLGCEKMAYSKVEPRHRALEALGWLRIRRSNSYDYGTATEQEIVSPEPGAQAAG